MNIIERKGPQISRRAILGTAAGLTFAVAFGAKGLDIRGRRSSQGQQSQ